jgi:diguanylate cyclase (GGDEF)-like protein
MTTTPARQSEGAAVTGILDRQAPSWSRTALLALRRWAWVGWIAFAIPGLLAYFLAPDADHGAQYNLFGTLSVLGMLAGTFLHESDKRGWWRLAAFGIGLYVLGDVTYTYLAAAGDVPFPSLADALYLTGFVVFAIAVTRLAELARSDPLRPALLDAALVATCVGIITWRLIIAPVTEAATDPLTAAIAMAFPMLDVLLAFVLLLYLLTDSHKAPSLWLLGIGLAAFLAADLAYASMSINGTYEAGMIVDAGWLVGYVMFAAAALHPTMGKLAVNAAAADPISNRRIALLVVVTSISGGAIALSPVETESQVVGAAVSVTALLVLSLLRFVGSLVDTRRLLVESTQLRDRVIRAARTDDLTGMPNRAGFTQTLRIALAQPGSRVGLLYFDLDEFTVVNNTWGHSTGDELLVLAASRLCEAVDSGDVVARFGGDEFSILVRGAATSDGCAAIADRILARFNEPFAIAGVSITVRPSIGIAVGGPGDDEVGLLRQADLAMYHAKQQGGRRWSLFEHAHEMVVDRYRLATELEAAIDAGELVVHYQPVCDLHTGRVVAVEALVRWQHPQRGLLQPDDFIGVAESAGLIGRLDLWVLQASLAQVRSWMDAGLWTPRHRMHVNFAPTDLEDPAIVMDIASALRDAGVPAGALSVEVTESALLEVDRTRLHLEQIAGLGVSLSLDDFGTRYAVLGTLAELPFTTLKVDRSFVVGIESAPRARLFEGILRLAEGLGLETLAEGIETESHRAIVSSLGCQLGQGYLLGRPVPPADVERALAPTGGRDRGRPHALRHPDRHPDGDPDLHAATAV